MHLALLVTAGPPPFSPAARLDAATADLETIAAVVSGEGAPPVCIDLRDAIAGPVLAGRVDLAEVLRAGRVEWVRSGWSRPSLPMLPESARDRQLRRESEVLESLGLSPGGLRVGTDWEPGLVASLARNGVEHLLMPGALIGGEAGIVENLGTVLPAVPVTPCPDDPAGIVATRAGDGDGILVLEVEASRLAEAVNALRSLPGCDLTTPAEFLARHVLDGKAYPAAQAGVWQRRLAESPGGELVYRKVIRLWQRVGDRTDQEAVDRVMLAQAAEIYEPSPDLYPLRQAAHGALAAAATVIESRGRGDWARARQVDWDADGRPEVHVELPELSAVVDPHDGGRILYIDDKPRAWPVTVLPAEDGALPAGVTCRLLPDGHDPAELLPVVHLAAVATAEQRRQAVVTLEGRFGGGRVACTVAFEGRSMRLSYALDGLPPGRFGCELPLAIEPAGLRIRVDGGEWAPLTEPGVFTGHRFRVSDGERQVLIGSSSPADCFSRPVGTAGVVLWPNWVISGTGHYELTVDLAP